MSTPSLEKIFRRFKNECDYLGLRYVSEQTTHRLIRNDKPEQNKVILDEGVMIEVLKDNHMSYAATSNLSEEAVGSMIEKLLKDSKFAAQYKVFSSHQNLRPKSQGIYKSSREKDLETISAAEITDFLMETNKALKTSPHIITRSTYAMLIENKQHYWGSQGTEVVQDLEMVNLDFQATAQKGSETQTRTANGWLAQCYQRGAEAFQDLSKYQEQCRKTSEEALVLVDAPNCPNEVTDLLIAPDQMMLQIHESIGHPLEYDRILGDERNFAGWSFVKPQDFGKLQYGSPIMNVSFDPTPVGQFASYAFDDGGNKATKEYLIKDGVLMRGLGSLESQHRLGLPGVANFRSASWNRAPIDRMANINLEPGTSTLEEMIGSIEKGILMMANRSWSIDDYRNKFQFGCEFGQLIENGRLSQIVKNPNYRGQTISFWNSLAKLGNAETFKTYGSPYCGKGEPSQIIRVGHASPYCLFKNVQVFGGSLH